MTRASLSRRQRRLEQPTGETAPVAIGTRYNDAECKWDLVVVIGGFGTEDAARTYGENNFNRLPAP